MIETPRTRLFVEDGLTAGAKLETGAERAHYLAHVLRLEPGAGVALFNGRDGEWLARIETLDKRRCTLRVAERLRPQAAAPDLWLLLAPVKRAALDLAVEKATELGVSVLWPVRTARTNARRVNLERFAAITREAAQQCGRLSLPELRPLSPLADILANWPAGRRLIHLDESGCGAPIADVLAQPPPPGGDALLVGPEGGFARSELDLLEKQAFVTGAGLGGRKLRAETATIAALACWQALVGDWRGQGQEKDDG